MLDVVATRSEDGRRLFVKAVNTSRDRALRTTVSVSGATVMSDATVQILNGASIETANSFQSPDAVTVRSTPLRSGPRFTIDLEPHSVTVITLPIASAR